MTFKISLSLSLRWLDHSNGWQCWLEHEAPGLGAHGLWGPAFALGGLCRGTHFVGLNCVGPGRKELTWGQRLHSEDTVSFPAFNLTFKQQKKVPSTKSHQIKLYGSTGFERFKALYMSNFLLQIPEKLWRPNKVQESRYYGGQTLWERKLLFQQVRHTEGTC